MNPALDSKQPEVLYASIKDVGKPFYLEDGLNKLTQKQLSSKPPTISSEIVNGQLLIKRCTSGVDINDNDEVDYCTSCNYYNLAGKKVLESHDCQGDE